VRRFSMMCWAMAALFFAPLAALAQDVSCTRGGLQRAVDLYISAQSEGDTSELPFAANLGYYENEALMDVDDGLINTPMTINHHRSLLDADSCQTFT